MFLSSESETFIGQSIISKLQLLFLFAACPSGQRPVGEVCEA